MTNDGASRYSFPGSTRALACRFRRLAEMVLLSNQECRWRGANDSTRGRVRSPDLNRNAYDLLADSRSKTSLNRISGEDLRWAHRAEPYVSALTLGDFFWGGNRAGSSFDWRRHACLYRPNEGDGASTERRGYSIRPAYDKFRLTQPRFLRFVLLALLVPILGRGSPNSKSNARLLPSFPMSKKARFHHLAAA